jgi:hypothetical protein
MEELKPDTAILLVSPDMKKQAERLERIITTLGINVTKRAIEPYDLASARDTFMNILADLEDHETTLNVTGGTKIMAFAAFEVFREMGKPIIYVDTQDKRIQVLSPKPKNVQFKGVIKVKTYLAAYGQNIEEDHTDHKKVNGHKSAFDSLIRDMEKFANPIGIMNSYAAPLRNARTFPLQVHVDDHHLSLPEFREVLSLFEEYGIIKKKEGKIVFPRLSDVEFVSGGWLEEYVFDVVSSLPVTDLRMSVKVKWDQARNAPVNEYDVLFTHENRLYLVECKTKRFLGTDRKETNDELIYKLENLRDAAGGLYGKGMLVSYRRLTDEQKRRLHTNRLEYCDAANLKNIKEKIKTWME